MSKNINNWFKEQEFNVAPLPQGHRERFLERLDAAPQNAAALEKSGKIIAFMHWQKWAVAASIILLLGIGFLSIPQTTTTIEQVSPQMAASQDIFNKTIDAELLKLEQQQSPETERIIADTKKNLAKLEKDYLAIAKDFKVNSNTAVMESMLLNFKTRVALLETALEHINYLKAIKKQHHETL
jgi:hypothetical protein